MQDRVEMYNTVLEMEQEDKKEPETIQRKNSKVMFEPPQLEVTNENEKVVTEEVEAEVHQVETKLILAPNKILDYTIINKTKSVFFI